jgi:hypothetical protein
MMVFVPQLVGERGFWEKSVFLGKLTVFESRMASASLEAAEKKLDWSEP